MGKDSRHENCSGQWVCDSSVNITAKNGWKFDAILFYEYWGKFSKPHNDCADKNKTPGHFFPTDFQPLDTDFSVLIVLL